MIAWRFVPPALYSHWKTEGYDNVQLAANLTYLFTELPMPERFSAAREAGFSGVEILFPYDLAASDLARYAQAEGLEFVAMNTPPPNWAGGPRGFAAIEGGEARFRSDFDRALRYGEVLRTMHISVMVGRANGPGAYRTLIDNLRWATRRAPHASLLIEPAAASELPGVFLDSLDLGLEVIARVDAPNLGLQFDAYHMHAMGLDVTEAWRRSSSMVRYIQIAGFPDRTEPLAGQIDYPAFFDQVRATGYGGWISAEYAPKNTTHAGLGWMPKT